MKKKSKLIILLIVFMCKFGVSFAQIDTAFWFAAPWVTPDHWWRDSIYMRFSGTPGTQVKMRQPAISGINKYDTIFTIPTTGYFNYQFWRDRAASPINFGFDSLETRPANTVVPYGLYISASANITAVYDVVTRWPNYYNPETFSLKGQNGFGKEFVCPFQNQWFNQNLGGDLNGDGIISQPKQQINIVATKPNTTVWITPRTNVVGHLANVSYSVFLPTPGSAYTIENTVQNTQVAGNNLSGTIVVADKDIAVTVADDSVRTPGGGCYDLIGDQIVPVDVVRAKYIVNKGAMVAGSKEGFYVVATQNFTGLKVVDALATTTLQLNKGDTYFYQVTQPLTYIEGFDSTKSLYLWQASGTGCEAGAAILPPVTCAGSNLVAFSRNTNQNFKLNIVCKNGAQNSFTLAGNTSVITGSMFSFVPGTNSVYVGAQIPLSITQIPIGSYTIGNTSDVFSLGIFDGGASTGGLFHYMSSFLRRPTVKTFSVNPICSTTPTVLLSGSVGGAASNGIWTTANGTGTFGAISNISNTISSVYTLSSTDTQTNSIKFYLITNDCETKKDSVTLTINKPPLISISSTNPLQCKNNIQAISLNASFIPTISAAGVSWVGGNGGSFSSPGAANTTYTPSTADITSGTITFTASTVGAISGCPNSTNTYTVGFVNPPSVNAGPDITICTNTQSFVLNGSVTGTTVTPNWNLSSIGNFNPGSSSPTGTFFTSPTFLNQTSVTFSLTAPPDGFCASVTDVFTVNIVPQPTVNAGNNFTVCASNLFVPLSGTVSGNTSTGLWSTPNGSGVFTQFGLAAANYTLSQNDTLNLPSITFMLSSSGGICPAVTKTISVQLIKSPLVTVGTNTAACESSPIQLNGQVTGFSTNNLWSSSSGTGSFVPNNTVLNALYYPSPGDLANGFVTFTLTASSIACPPVSKNFIANFVKAPIANFQLASSACINSPLLFNNTTQNNGTSSLTYNWDFGDNISSTIKDPTHTFTATGNYVVTYTVTGTNSLNITCTDTLSKSIFVNPLPFANFTYTNACQALPIQFNDSSYATPGFIAGYSWFFGPGTPTVNIKNPVYTFTTAGTFGVDLTVTSNFGCKRKVTKNVTVRNKPIADFGMTNNPTVAQEPVYFSDFSSPVGLINQWIWSFGDESYGNVQSPTHTYNNSGGYNITLTIFDDQGCRDTITKRIEVSLLPQVPTAFTPNGDGSNDLLFVKGGPFQKIKFKVFNNWGELIFDTEDQTKGWDGKKNGEDQPIGVYVWTLEVDMYNNRVVKKNGDVTIIR
jgi:gliding motility-associated-like protein